MNNQNIRVSLIVSLVHAFMGKMDSRIRGIQMKYDPKQRKTNPMFGNYLIRGQKEITDPQTRDRIFASFKTAVSQGGERAKCFFPHHAIRAVHQGKTVDYTICFECRSVEIKDGESEKSIPISSGGEAEFNEYLKAAGLPMPKK